MVAAFVAQTDQKNQKDRYSTNIFVEISWYEEAEVIIKFSDSVFDHEILSFWSYEKPSWYNVVHVHFM